MGRITPLLLNIKSWIFSNYLTVLLCFTISILSFPEFDLTYASGIDEPLPWLFNFLADGHYSLGKNIIFPHGPLAFLLYPLQTGNNLYVAIFIYLLCPTVLGLCIFKLAAFHGSKNTGFVTLIVTAVMFVSSLQLQLIGLTLCHIFLFYQSNKRTHLFAAVFFSVFNLFVKSYGGMICGLILFGELIHLLFVRKNIKLAATIVAIFILVFFGFWLSLYQTFSGSLHFLFGQYQLSTDNSEAASFNQKNEWLLIFVSLTSFSLIPVISKNKSLRYFFFLSLLPLFGAWKHAMARGEHVHLGGFLNFLLLLTFLLWIILNEKKGLIYFLSLFSVGSFALNMILIEEYPAPKKTALFGTLTPYHLLANYDTIAGTKNYMTKGNLNNKHKFLPDSVLKLIGKKTVDVYPWNYAYIGANKLNWRPRPVIQSYASYTSWLDRQNSDHIVTGNSADYIIWESTEKDYNERKLEGIDGRSVLNDEPQSIINFFANYKVRLKTEEYLLYEKLNEPLTIKTDFLSETKKIRYNEWVEVPEADAAAITRVRLKTSKSFIGAVKSFFYKAEIYYIFYELENKRVYSHRIVPKNAADGVWLNPFVPDHMSEIPDSPVKKIKFVCLNEKMESTDIEIRFQQISYSSAGFTVDASEHCFKRSATRPKNQLFFTLNKTESTGNMNHIQKNPVAEKTHGTFLSPPLCYVLAPGRTTDHIICKIDRQQLHSNTSFIRFMLEAFISGDKKSNVLFVIAQDDIILWSSEIKYQILEGEDFWNYACYSEKIPLAHLNIERPFHFYVFNASDDLKVFADDFSVTISQFP